ncbi:MAG TPA: hypothetical protein VF765_19525 [Polyangiaceae bacterium]
MKQGAILCIAAFAAVAAFQGCAQGSSQQPIDFPDGGDDDSGSGGDSGGASGSGSSSGGGGSTSSSGASSSGSGGGSSSGADAAGTCGNLDQPCCNGAYCAGTLTCSPNVVCVDEGQADSGSGSGGGSGSSSGGIDSGPTCAPGLSLCNGACIDTTSDPANCGSCGHVCQNTTCTDGACDSTVLSSGFVPPGRLAIDANNAYWTNGDGSIRSVPLAGGTTATLATGLTQPMGIAVDTQNVYAASQDGRVVSTPLSGGGTLTVLAQSQPTPYALAIDATNVYWSNVASGAGNGSIMACAKAGCSQAPTTLASGIHVQYPYGLVVSGTNVYWTSFNFGGEINVVPTTGGMFTNFSANLGYPYELSIAGSVTLAVLYGQGGSIVEVPSGGGSATSLVGGQAFPTEGTTDGTAAYWTLTIPSAQNGATLMKAPLATGQAQVLAKNMQPAGSVQVDSQYVYWLSNEGALRRLPK